jgi:hypothetical protein
MVEALKDNQRKAYISNDPNSASKPPCALDNSVSIIPVILPPYTVQAPEAFVVHTVNCDLL